MRYFFDLYEGDHWTRDDWGLDCRNDREARRQAVLALTEMGREYIPGDGDEMDLLVRVRRAEAVSFTVRLQFSTEAGPALQGEGLAR